MAIEQRNYDPAVMYGAQHNITVDLGDVLDSNDNEILEFDAVASAVNFVRIANSATGDAVDITAQGDDTNVGLDLSTKGTGSMTLWSGDGARELLVLVNVAAAVDQFQISPAATGGAGPILEATGDGTNIDIRFLAKGTGAHVFNNGTDPVQIELLGAAGGFNNEITDVNGNEILALQGVASAVNEFTITNAAASGNPAFGAQGGDTDISVDIDGKGAGSVRVAMAASSGGMRYKRSVLASSGNTTMTSAMSGSVMLLDGAATDYTLPAIGAGDVGMEFWFVATIIATDQTITAGAGDLLTGSIEIVDTAGDTDVFVPDVTDDLIITLNGTTTGGKTVGSWCHLVAISATRWWVEGVFLTATETQATPFS